MKRYVAGEYTIDILPRENGWYHFYIKDLSGQSVLYGGRRTEARALESATKFLAKMATSRLRVAEEALESAQYAKIWAQSQLDDIAKIKEENGL